MQLLVGPIDNKLLWSFRYNIQQLWGHLSWADWQVRVISETFEFNLNLKACIIADYAEPGNDSPTNLGVQWLWCQQHIPGTANLSSGLQWAGVQARLRQSLRGLPLIYSVECSEAWSGCSELYLCIWARQQDLAQRICFASSCIASCSSTKGNWALTMIVTMIESHWGHLNIARQQNKDSNHSFLKEAILILDSLTTFSWPAAKDWTGSSVKHRSMGSDCCLPWPTINKGASRFK